MAQYQHLRLLRLPEQLERRKRRGFGTAQPRNRDEHKANLERQLAAAIDAQQRRRRPGAINPALILRVQMSGPLQEDDWAALGLTVVSSDPDRTLVLFSSSDEMTEFRRRLDAYAAAIPAG